MYVRRPTNQRFPVNPSYAIKRLKHGEGSVMIWASMLWRGVGPIFRVEEKLIIIWSLMHDKDPKYIARTVKRQLEEKQIQVLEWPAQRPDLHPIQNLWGDFEVVIKTKSPVTLYRLWNTIKKAWHNIAVINSLKILASWNPGAYTNVLFLAVMSPSEHRGDFKIEAVTLSTFFYDLTSQLTPFLCPAILEICLNMLTLAAIDFWSGTGASGAKL
ncbi:hypothetical protein Trydic_g3412 [Trypoxylus dichotomus]